MTAGASARGQRQVTAFAPCPPPRQRVSSVRRRGNGAMATTPGRLPTRPAPACRRQSGRPNGKARGWRMIDTPRQRGRTQVRSEPAARAGQSCPAAALPGERRGRSRLLSPLPADGPTKPKRTERDEIGNCPEWHFLKAPIGGPAARVGQDLGDGIDRDSSTRLERRGELTGCVPIA